MSTMSKIPDATVTPCLTINKYGSSLQSKSKPQSFLLVLLLWIRSF